MKFSEFYLCINNFCAVLKDAKSVSSRSLLSDFVMPAWLLLRMTEVDRRRAWRHQIAESEKRGFGSRPPFFLRHSRASETRARVKITPRQKRRDFHARSRFAHSSIPEEKWGTTRGLRLKINRKIIFVQVSSPEACFISKIQQFNLPSFHSAWHQNRNAASLKKVSPLDFQQFSHLVQLQLRSASESIQPV